MFILEKKKTIIVTLLENCKNYTILFINNTIQVTDGEKITNSTKWVIKDIFAQIGAILRSAQFTFCIKDMNTLNVEITLA